MKLASEACLAMKTCVIGHRNPKTASPATGDENMGDVPNKLNWPPEACLAMKTCVIGHQNPKIASPATGDENMGDGPKTLH